MKRGLRRSPRSCRLAGPSTVSFARRGQWLLGPDFFASLTDIAEQGTSWPPLKMDIAIQAPLASIVGSSHGWHCSRTIPPSGVHWWFRIWSGRVCHGLCGVRHMAARDHTYSDGHSDRRLRPLDAGLWRLEVEALA